MSDQKSESTFLQAIQNTFPTQFTDPKSAQGFPRYSPDKDRNLAKSATRVDFECFGSPPARLQSVFCDFMVPTKA